MSKATRARLVEAVQVLNSCGHPVRGLRLHPDGSVSVLTVAEADALPSPGEGDWVDLAGETEAPGRA